MIRAVALLAVIACARLAAADVADVGSADAEAVAARQFSAALGAGDIEALEQLGEAQPITRWTDDAWTEAARLAARDHDFARARRDLERAIAVSTDELLIRRAKGELVRIARLAGDAGEWSAVAAEHERLVSALRGHGDPRTTLRTLEALVQNNPAYPRRVIVMLAIASAWEREGEPQHATRWLRQARSVASDPLERLRSHADLVRALVRSGALAEAEEELQSLAAPPPLVAELRAAVERSRLRHRVRLVMWAVIALLALVALVALRRAAGSWRAAGRRVVRPPAEVLFLVPVAAVLVAVASTGNPLVARAVRTIVLAGIGASWISAALLVTTRVTLRRALIHAVASLLAVAAITYLAVDSGHLIDFVLETWRGGHERG